MPIDGIMRGVWAVWPTSVAIKHHVADLRARLWQRKIPPGDPGEPSWHKRIERHGWCIGPTTAVDHGACAGALGCCAVVQTGCLHPPTTPAESFGQQLYTVQPGTPLATAPAAALPGPVDPNAAAAAPLQPAPFQPAPFATVPLAAPPLQPAPAVAAPALPTPVPPPATNLAAANPAAVSGLESGILLNPPVVVAQVGANVVMVAGVFGPGRAMLPGRRVEWTLAAGGVGQITAVGSAPSGFFGAGAPSRKK